MSLEPQIYRNTFTIIRSWLTDSSWIQLIHLIEWICYKIEKKRDWLKIRHLQVDLKGYLILWLSSMNSPHNTCVNVYLLFIIDLFHHFLARPRLLEIWRQGLKSMNSIQDNRFPFWFCLGTWFQYLISNLGKPLILGKSVTEFNKVAIFSEMTQETLLEK